MNTTSGFALGDVARSALPKVTRLTARQSLKCWSHALMSQTKPDECAEMHEHAVSTA